MIVSHDREFLDRTTNIIVEVTGQQADAVCRQLQLLPGRESRCASRYRKGLIENQQQQIRQEERFIERFKAKASKAKQAKSRQKTLDNMERIEDVAPEAAKSKFPFPVFNTQPGRHVLAWST